MKNNMLKRAIALTTACFITIGLANPLSDSYLLMGAYNVSAEESEELIFTDNNDITYDSSLDSGVTDTDLADGPYFMDNAYSTPRITFYSADDYKKWAQGDSRWGNLKMGNSSYTVSSIGCVATSITKLIIQSGLREQDSFNVRSFVESMNSVGGFNGYGAIIWDKTSSVVNGFNYFGAKYSNDRKYDSSDLAFTNNVISWINEGYHLVIGLPYTWSSGGLRERSVNDKEGHWVAVDEEKTLSTGQVYIMDSLGDTAGNANIPLTSRYKLHMRVVLYRGGATANYTPSGSSEITMTNASEPSTTMNIGNNFTVSGQIASGIPLTYIEVGCYDLNDRLITGSGTDADGSRNYNIRNLDNQVNFNALSSGVYKYKVMASNSDKTATLIEKSFIILGNDMTIEDGTYTICSAQNTTYQMTVAGSNTQLNRGNGSPEQVWLITYWRDGYYTIRNYHSGLYLDVYNAGNTEGTNVWQHEKNDSAAQHWQILPAGGDTYCIIPQCAGERCLDAVGGSAGDGVNLALYAPHLGANQRFVFTHTNCNFTSGTKITFNANGGTLPTAYTSYTANGVNKSRGVGELIVYNVPNMLVNTNEYGNEAMVNYSGLVTDYRRYGNTSHLYVPWGGFVISGHLNGGTDGSSFVDKIRTGYYVGFDYSTKKVSVYTSVDGYLANHKYVNSGSTYGSLPVPTRSGYNFDGWYTSASGGTKVTSSSTYSASRLYAHWSSADEKVVKISSIAFPDPVFRAYVSSSSVDSDGDGYLSESELKFRKTMNLSNQNISSLEGIEYFTSLGWLTCQGNNLTNLDLSHNKELEVLNCSDNKLTAIDISNNKKLSQFLCSGNNLTSLDVSNNPNISIEHFYGTNKDRYNIGTILDSYYLSNLTKYGFVPSKASNWKGATYNSATNTLTDFTSSTVSYDYDCGNGFTVTFYLIADSIPKYVFVDVNSTNFPDSVFRNYVLSNIDTNGDKKLSKTEISNTTSIKLKHEVSGGAKNLVGIEYFTELIELDCSFNSITSLDLSKNTKLQRLFCGSNELTELGISNNGKLTYLNCMENQLRYIDTSNNRILETLDCNYNQISVLDLSLNTELVSLDCYRNKLKDLDLINNSKLKSLNAHSNQLTSLNLSYTQVNRTIASGNVLDIGTVSSYKLSNLSRYGFNSAKASNWRGATYDSNTDSLINITSSEIKYDYNCGNGVTVEFALYCSPTTLTDYSTNISISAGNGFGYNSLFGATLESENIQVGSGLTSIAVYEMILTKDDVVVNTQGTVTISIPVPDGENGQTLKVYRQTENGSLMDMKSSYNLSANTLDFVTTTLGTYVVIKDNNASNKKGDVNGDGIVGNKDVTALRKRISDGDPYTAAADINGDGSVGNKDVTALRKILAEI